MEDIPSADDSVDVVVSNGAINLSPRKSRVLAEIARVLGSPSPWAGCIAGALSEGVLRRKLDRAGLIGVRIGQRVAVSLDALTAYPLLTEDAVELMRRTMTREDLQHTATSILVQAVKPAVMCPAGVRSAPGPTGQAPPTTLASLGPHG